MKKNSRRGSSEYAYYDTGSLHTVTYPNGVVTTYTYNVVNQLETVTTRDGSGNVISGYTYGLDNTGRRDTITEANGRFTDNDYDDLYRLTGETITDPNNGNYSASYRYDWSSNRTYSIVNGVHTSFAYNDNDQLESQGGVSYTFDDNGNLKTETEDGVVTTYFYDEKNQLTSVEKGGVTTGYTYNHNGIRTGKTEGGQTTTYVVDENRDYAQVLQEIGGGTVKAQYTYGLDLINQSREGQLSYYQYDGLGSTRALTDATGAVTDQYSYEAFGELLNSTGATQNSYLYAGEQFDSGLNQYYLRARYYDQSVGRFTQLDTFQGWDEDPITQNKYLYANVDPANAIDPSGHMVGFAEFGIASRINAIFAAMATPSYSSAIFRVGAGLISGGLAYGLSQEYKEFISRNAPAMSRMLEEKREKTQAEVTALSRGRPVLYHYTDRAAALAIFATGEAFVTPPFRGLGTNGNTRPAGFYATDVAPWDVSMTQADLSAQFYGGNRHRDVSWFVAVDATLFSPVYGASREHVMYGSQSIGIVSVDPVAMGPNLMLPGL